MKTSTRTTTTTTWLSGREVAQRADVPYSTLMRWVDQGKVPFHRRGDGRVFFRAQDVEVVRAMRQLPGGES